jgi:CRP/FNR family transcriptional regulator, cyclic AMP receptor protein
MKELFFNFFNKKETEDNLIKEALKNNILFKDLSIRQINILSKIIHIRKYSSGEYIFKQDKPGAGMFIIVKGKIIIQKETRHINETNENEKLENTMITTLYENDFFGEISLVESNSYRSASAKALSSSLLIGFFKPDLLSIMNTHPSIGMKILYRMCQVLSKRLIESNLGK